MMTSFLGDFSFEKLIAPIDPDRFFSEYWETKVLPVRREAQAFYGDLLTISEVDAVVAQAPNHLIIVPHADEGRFDYDTADDIAEINDIAVTELHNGGTLLLGYTQERLPNLALLCRLLGRELSFRFQAGVYMTPPGSQAFRPHYDWTEVFVLQILGSKLWRTETSQRVLPRTGEFDRGDTEIAPLFPAAALESSSSPST